MMLLGLAGFVFIAHRKTGNLPPLSKWLRVKFAVKHAVRRWRGPSLQSVLPPWTIEE
jgi:hypothetical protein